MLKITSSRTHYYKSIGIFNRYRECIRCISLLPTFTNSIHLKNTRLRAGHCELGRGGPDYFLTSKQTNYLIV